MSILVRRLYPLFLVIVLAVGARAADYLVSIQEAVAAIELGDYNEAARAVEKAFTVSDSDPLGRMTLGTIYLHAGRLSEAESEFRAALSVRPEEWRAQYALGLIALLRNDRAEAEKRFAESRKHAESAEDLAVVSRYLDYIAEKPRKPSAVHTSAVGKQISAMALVASGDKQAARRLLAEVISAPAPLGFEEFRAPIATFDRKQPVAIPRGKLTWKPVDRKNAPRVSGTIGLTADASKLDEIHYVTYYVDGTFTGVTNYQPFRFEWNTLNVPNGLHEVRIEAQDRSGRTMSKKTVWVNVVNANPRHGPVYSGEKAAELSDRLWKCIRLTESRKLAHYTLAKLYLEAGDRENAIRNFEYALAYQPGYLDTRKKVNELTGRQKGYAEVHNVPQAGKAVAITFDDGPNERTQETLEVLARLDVRATFFLVGFRAEAQPDLVKAIQAGGHDIENHSYSHPNLTTLTMDEAESELAKCSAVILALTGKSPRYFRPPGGHGDEATKRAAARLGLTGVYWTINCNPWEGASPAVLSGNVIGNISDGAIILMHNGESATNAALPMIVDELRQQGYRFVTVSELVASARDSNE